MGGLMSQLSDKALNEKISALPKEMTPERDLWQGIERAITSQQLELEHKKPVKVHLALAASVLLSVVLSWKLLYQPNIQPIEIAELTIAEQLEQDFQQQKRLVLTSFGQQDLTSVPADMKVQLDELAAAQNSIKKALESDPNNIELVKLLRWAQSQELALIEAAYAPKWQQI